MLCFSGNKSNESASIKFQYSFTVRRKSITDQYVPIILTSRISYAAYGNAVKSRSKCKRVE